MTATFDDPDFTAQSRGSLGPDGINALSLYGTYSGAGVRVGVVDTGIRWDDPELVGQVDTTGGWNAITGTPDAYADASESPHGTNVALILGARANNGTGGIGAAWGATIVPFKFQPDPPPDQQLELLERQKELDISQNSWGVHPLVENFLGDYAAHGAAIAEAATVGRFGLGTVIIRSTGTGTSRTSPPAAPPSGPPPPAAPPPSPRPSSPAPSPSCSRRIRASATATSRPSSPSAHAPPGGRTR
jgi:hypothetical protein